MVTASHNPEQDNGAKLVSVSTWRRSPSVTNGLALIVSRFFLG